MSVKCEQYYLTNIAHTYVPSKMMFIDTETTQHKSESVTKHNLRLGWLCYIPNYNNYNKQREKWIEFNNEEKICEYINDKCTSKETLYLFAHNAFFDCQVIRIFDILPKYGWKVTFWYEKGITYLLTLKSNGRILRIVSTTNYFPFALSEMGKMIGLNKQSVDFDNVDDKQLSIYCRNDVEILKESMIAYFRFIIKHDCGRFAMTRSSQAMNSYRKAFMLKNIVIHKHIEVLRLERNAYMGGRTECHKIGKMKGRPFVTLDINSMYPYQMYKQDLPIRLIDYRNDCNIDILSRLLEYNCVISHVFVDTDKPVYAVRNGGRIIFPIGKFDCYLCTGGLKYALQHNHIKSVYDTAVYEKHRLFGDYINYYYKLREQYKRSGNKIYDTFCKLFMNGLYGKFGQRITKTIIDDKTHGEIYNRCTYYDSESNRVGIETIMMKTRILQTEIEEINNIMVSIPAHITEYARLQLWDIMETVGLKNIMYCDTDSVKIRKSKMHRVQHLIDNYKLGMLKIEKQSSELIIYSSKDYIDDGKITLKGVPRSAKKIDDNTYIYDQFLSQISHLKRNEYRSFIVSSVVKHLNRIYLKGLIDKYGNVHPHKYNKSYYLNALHEQIKKILKSLK